MIMYYTNLMIKNIKFIQTKLKYIFAINNDNKVCKPIH